nr:hypothetical protein [Deltaproteobacteria bacterium]
MSTGRGLPGRRASPSLGIVLLGTAAVGLLLFGGALPGARVVLHGGTALALLISATLADRSLGGAGHLPRWVAGTALFAIAIGAGLVPLPASLLAAIAPGVAADWPGAAWHMASTDPEGTVNA